MTTDSEVLAMNPGDVGYVEAKARIDRSVRNPRRKLDWDTITEQYNALKVNGFLLLEPNLVSRLSNLVAVMDNHGLVRNEDYAVSRVEVPPSGKKIAITRLSNSTL